MPSDRGMDVMKSYATISPSRDGRTVIIDDVDDRTVMTDDVGQVAYCNISHVHVAPITRSNFGRHFGEVISFWSSHRRLLVGRRVASVYACARCC